MSDEQREAWAHWVRVGCRIEDQPVPDRTVKCLRALALLGEAMIAENPYAQQQWGSVLLGLMDPHQQD